MPTSQNEYQLPCELPHELHEWIEIQAGQEGDLIWVGGLFSPGGEKRPVYDHAHIALSPSREEAIELGKRIACLASTVRMIMSIHPAKVSFSEHF